MKSSTKVQGHVGSLHDMADRFTSAWNKASKGARVNAPYFCRCSNNARCLIATPIGLLKHVRQHGADNVKALVLALGRDYKCAPRCEHSVVSGPAFARPAQVIGPLG